MDNVQSRTVCWNIPRPGCGGHLGRWVVLDVERKPHLSISVTGSSKATFDNENARFYHLSTFYLIRYLSLMIKNQKNLKSRAKAGEIRCKGHENVAEC